MKRILILVAAVLVLLVLIAVAMIPGLDSNGVKTKIVHDELLVIYNDGTVINMGPVEDLKNSDCLDFYPLPDGTYGVKMGKAEYLEEITIPSHYRGCAVTRILASGFAGATNLMRITIPDTVTVIENGAFQSCKRLERVDMGRGVTTIETSAFDSCTSLRNITLSENLQTIGISAFGDCRSFTEIRIPDHTKRIEAEAFKNCYNVESIIIPIRVESIGTSAFTGEYKADLHYAGTAEQWLSITNNGAWSSWFTKHFESTP
ncbi:MAG: leucine-rich repeat domain-containing protein [Clostridia bacterium]|nr:leucine-rich repeat domain-containing protein [Clostridia bacterium]